MEYLIYIIIAVVAGRIGWSLHWAWVLYIIQEHPERMERACKISRAATKLSTDQIDVVRSRLAAAETTEQQDTVIENISDDVIELTIEQVGSQTYAYNKHTGQFLAQGPTLDDAMKIAAGRFPNKKFWHSEVKQDNQTA
jgi:hypothetical protein